MRTLARLLYLLALTSLTFCSSSAQVVTGTPPFGSFAGGPDAINLGNLNVHLDVPVLARSGRAGFNFTYDLNYDSSVWYPVGVSGSQTWQPVTNWGWRGQTEVATGYVSYTATTAPWCLWGGQYWGMQTTYSNWVYHDSFGAPHAFAGYTYVQNGAPAHCSPVTGSLTITTGDGSGWTLRATGANLTSITSTSGEVLHPPLNLSSGAASATDRNGNQITVNSSGQFFDTLSSTIAVLTVAGAGTPSSPMTFTYSAPGGAAHYTVNYTNYTIATNFGVAGISEYRSAAALPLITTIVLPDSSQYSFSYESTPGSCTPYSGTTCTTARLVSVTLPTGGTISYAYAFTGCSAGNNGILLDGSTSCLQRTTPDGIWTYAQSKGTGAASTTSITDPLSKQTVLQFQGIYETQRQVYDGPSTGTVQQTVNTCYNSAASPCTSTAITLPIAQKSVISNVPGSTLQTMRVVSWNSFGMPTEIDEYDFGSGAPPATPMRRTFNTYPNFSNNINAFSQTTTICSPTGTASACNGAGTVVAQTTNAYDQTTPTVTSGTPQHVSVSGSRANLTGVTYLTSGASTLSKTFTYYDTGMPKTAVDVNGASSTITYNYLNATATCGNAFPTSVSEPLTLSRLMTWNCTGGVQLTATDESGGTMTSTYSDPYFWRMAALADATGATVYTGYAVGGNVVDRGLLFNTGNSSTVNVASNFDGIGRPTFDQHYQSPSGTTFDTVSYTYDALGRLFTTTIPCPTAAGVNCPGSTPKTTTTYDFLGRTTQVTDGGGGWVKYTYNANDVVVEVGPNPTGENTKKRQLEFDGLGRLKSVCEITSAPGSGLGPCGQNTPATGLLTQYSYDLLGNLTGVTQNAQSASTQTRTYLYDSISRLTSETNPESGLTLYTYDTATGCSGAYNGDLVKKTDQQGDTICFAYDALHRNTSITYSGSYAGVTPSKYFVYDTATVNGVAMANAKGRLAEAYTCTTCPGTKITDEGFSYTARGEISDVYQTTPHTTPNYYHVAQTYWPHGLPSQLSATYAGAVITGLPTINYGGATGAGIDGQGRLTQVTASSGQNPVTGTNYNPYGSPPQITATLGSGDSDVFSYDANTGRMTQYKFTVGTTPQSVIGNLTWNSNGTLQKLAITDPFNAANSQTCKYGDPSASVAGYDDLGRLIKTDCGTAAAQTFSYDAFGNINKQGSPGTFNASYNSATNHITTVGTFTATYDNNGNVTNDGLHTYSWDADNNSITQDTVNLTFDALGRMVEQARGTSYTQIVYSPTGSKLALMSGGATLQEAFIPLPSGGTAVYTSSGLAYYRHSDWLGSSRFASTTSRTMYSSTAYAPFGEPYAQAGTTDLNFTGMNSDTSGSSYDFPARQYGTQGRWPAPDPAGLAAVDPSYPQSWNRYAYVFNNPLDLTDPFGLYVVCDGAIAYDYVDYLVDNIYEGTDLLPVGPCVNQSSQPWLMPPDNGNGPDGHPRLPFLKGQPKRVFGIPDPCANPTLAAAGVDIRERLAIVNAQTHGPFTARDPLSSLSFALRNFFNLVHTGGPFDDKNQPGPGTNEQRVDAGNISYGVTCPYSAGACQFAAGAAQTLSGNPDPNGTLRTGFDTPSDNAAIKVGQAMKAAGCND